MTRKLIFVLLALLSIPILIAILLAALFVPVTIRTEPAEASSGLADFEAELLAAVSARDSGAMQALMGEPFLSGWWRWERIDTPPAEAAADILANQLGPESKPAIAEGVDLATLMGGTDPASLAHPEAKIAGTFLMTGWGLDGRDEAIVLVGKRGDGSLYWHGLIVVQGGFTSPETGGVQPFVNETLGFRFWYPNGYEITQTDNNVVVYAPPTSSGHRERLLIDFSEMPGWTVEEIANDMTADLTGFNIEQTFTSIGGEAALIIEGMPGQDSNRQVLVKHNDRAYRMMFVPSNPLDGQAYWEMEQVYGPVINTFRFID